MTPYGVMVSLAFCGSGQRQKGGNPDWRSAIYTGISAGSA